MIAVLLVALVSGCGSSSGAGSSSPVPQAAVSSASAVPVTGAALAPSQATTDLDSVPVSDLPPQAVDTLELIAVGGPFPYDRDGVTFQNREGILPAQPQGFYREYTVITPGSSDRGARRIVAGRDGSRFYTDDHYDSFREVVAR